MPNRPKAFRLKITTDSAAFDTDNGGAPAEVARILRDIAQRIEDANTLPEVLRLYDFNGNYVGEAKAGGR